MARLKRAMTVSGEMTIMAGDTILDIRDLRKSFGAYQALKGVSLSVAQGEFLALVGPDRKSVV